MQCSNLRLEKLKMSCPATASANGIHFLKDWLQ